MRDQEDYELRKARIENFFKTALKKHFPEPGKRVSLRQQKRFIEKVTKEIGARFGKDVLCLVNFENGEWSLLVSPARTHSTDKGRLYQSFSHPRVYYTTHCVERFSERTGSGDNCILVLDMALSDALVTYGADKEYLIGPAGVFAYETDGEKLVIKTFINYELLSDEQIARFYRPDIVALIEERLVSDDPSASDFILADEEKPTLGRRG